MDLETIAAELYGLPPEEFTGARNSRVKALKADGDADLAAAVGRLRKPSVGAWLLNQLVRQQPAQMEGLFELGERLRAAQGTLGVAELRALGEQRRVLTRAVAEQAADIGREAGRTVTAQVLADVEETLRSAMVDPVAGTALATGLLVTTFSSTGLEPVDLTRAVAVEGAVGDSPPRGSTDRTYSPGRDGADGGADDAERERQRAEALSRAQHALADAERTAEVARRECEAARTRAVEAGRRREDLSSELAELRRRVEALERRVEDATETESAARRDQIAATRAERSAGEAVERARRRFEAAGGAASS